ncbi:MAG: hypothetical protein JXR96_05350 [Deltaproteobacteria bacterium]|nr:hypothetical protein [Deltaproteobacteria bacterium]
MQPREALIAALVMLSAACTGELALEGKECSSEHPCSDGLACLPVLDDLRMTCQSALGLCLEDSDCPEGEGCAGGVCAAEPDDVSVTPPPDLSCYTEPQAPPPGELTHCPFECIAESLLGDNVPTDRLQISAFTLDDYFSSAAPAAVDSAVIGEEGTGEGQFSLDLPVDTWLVLRVEGTADTLVLFSNLAIFGLYLPASSCDDDAVHTIWVPALTEQDYQHLASRNGQEPIRPGHGLVIGQVLDCDHAPLADATGGVSLYYDSASLVYSPADAELTDTDETGRFFISNVETGQGLAAARAKDESGDIVTIGPRWLEVQAAEASLVLLENP